MIRNMLAAFAMLSMLAVNMPAMAQAKTGDAGATGPVKQLSGWRGLEFGMSEKDARDVLKKKFKIKNDEVQAGDNRIEKTRFIAVRVPDVIKDMEDATVLLVFGYQSRALDRIEVFWSALVSEKEKNVRLQDAGSQLRNYFLNQGYDPKTIAVNRPLSEKSLVFFQGRDRDGKLVTLSYSLQGVRLEEGKNDEAAKQNPERATLRLSYVAKPDAPDIFKIETGEF